MYFLKMTLILLWYCLSIVHLHGLYFCQEQNTKEAIQVCSETIEMEKQNVNALCDRADSYLLEDNLDDGKKGFN